MSDATCAATGAGGDIETRCHKPGCGKRTEVFGSKWCSACWYPSIDDDHARYRAYREDGYGAYQAKLMVGWADPPDHDATERKPLDSPQSAANNQD